MHRPRTEGRREGVGEVSWAQGGCRTSRGMEGRGRESVQAPRLGRPSRADPQLKFQRGPCSWGWEVRWGRGPQEGVLGTRAGK